MWAVGRVGYISTVNESTGSGTQYVSYNNDPLNVWNNNSGTFPPLAVYLKNVIFFKYHFIYIYYLCYACYISSPSSHKFITLIISGE